MTQDQSNRMETPTHGDDGTRQVDTASYEGTAFQCECGERFVHYCDLIGHIAKHPAGAT